MSDEHKELSDAFREARTKLAEAERRLIEALVLRAFLERAGGDVSEAIAEQAGLEREVAELRAAQHRAERKLAAREGGGS